MADSPADPSPPGPVFVTGGTGFLGSALVARLLSQGYQVRALVRSRKRVRHAGAVDHFFGDLTDPTSLAGCLDGCTAVLHAAGVVGDGHSVQACQRGNVDATRHLVREAVATGVSRFVHVSSVSVYGRVADTDLHEDQPCKQIGDAYGDSKVDAEEVVLGQEGLDWSILRPTVLYGPEDPYFLPRLLEKMRTRELRIIGSGNQRMSLIHVDDAARAIVAVLQGPQNAQGIYNLANPESLPIRDLFQCVARAAKYPQEFDRVPYGVASVAAALLEAAGWMTGRSAKLTRFAVRILGREYRYPVDKIERELGFRPAIELEKGLAEAVQAILNHGLPESSDACPDSGVQ